VPYDELVGLRLEDGVDPTRKQDYLTEEEFSKVSGGFWCLIINVVWYPLSSTAMVCQSFVIVWCSSLTLCEVVGARSNLRQVTVAVENPTVVTKTAKLQLLCSLPVPLIT
jgi:hypothetical protein